MSARPSRATDSCFVSKKILSTGFSIFTKPLHHLHHLYHLLLAGHKSRFVLLLLASTRLLALTRRSMHVHHLRLVLQFVLTARGLQSTTTTTATDSIRSSISYVRPTLPTTAEWISHSLLAATVLVCLVARTGLTRCAAATSTAVVLPRSRQRLTRSSEDREKNECICKVSLLNQFIANLEDTDSRRNHTVAVERIQVVSASAT